MVLGIYPTKIPNQNVASLDYANVVIDLRLELEIIVFSGCFFYKVVKYLERV